MPEPCASCGGEIDNAWPGKGGEICQSCWEEECDDSWWLMVCGERKPMSDDRNARAARLAGWRYLDKPERINNVNLAAGWWITPKRDACVDPGPDYAQSIDLIQRDLLPLVEQAGKVTEFLQHLWKWWHTEDVPERSEWALLTVPASVILDAVLAVLEDSNATD